MSSEHRNLSAVEGSSPGSARPYVFGIVWSEWNSEITTGLLNGAKNTLISAGALEKNLIIHAVPGSFELTLGAQYLAETRSVDAIICLGCIIQGQTRHFDFICNAVANGITNLNIKYNLPVIFGVLTPDNFQQARDRSGGTHGNKGDEAAITAIKMLTLRDQVRK